MGRAHLRNGARQGRPGSDLAAFFDQVAEGIGDAVIHVIAVVVIGKGAGAHVGGVVGQALDRDLGQVGVALGELGFEIGEDAKKVVAEQDLPVSARAGADADGRDLELGGDDAGDRGRHRLELEHETAGVLDGQRVLQDVHRVLGRLALHAEAAIHRDAVRGHADMAGRGDACVHQCLEDVGLAAAALGFDRVAPAVLHEAGGVGQGAVDRVVALVGHTAEREGVGRATADGLGVHDHHVHCRGHGRGVAVGDHGEAVADHHDIDTRRLGPLCRGVIGHGGVDHARAVMFRGPDLGNCPFLSFGHGGVLP